MFLEIGDSWFLKVYDKISKYTGSLIVVFFLTSKCYMIGQWSLKVCFEFFHLIHHISFKIFACSAFLLSNPSILPLPIPELIIINFPVFNIYLSLDFWSPNQKGPELNGVAQGDMMRFRRS